MSYARQMLGTCPVSFDVDTSRVAATIDALNDYANSPLFTEAEKAALESADATAFDQAKARLAQVGYQLAPVANGAETADPWGTRIRITRG